MSSEKIRIQKAAEVAGGIANVAEFKGEDKLAGSGVRIARGGPEDVGKRGVAGRDPVPRGYSVAAFAAEECALDRNCGAAHFA